MTFFFPRVIDSDHVHSGLALCSVNQGLDSLEQLQRGDGTKAAALLGMLLLYLTPRCPSTQW